MTVFIEIPKDDAKRIDKYAKEHNLSMQELFLNSVLKQIDSETAVGSITNLLTKYTEEETEYSFDEFEN